MEPLPLQQALHHLHRQDVALVGLGRRRDGVAARLGAARRVEEPFREVAGRPERDEPELVLPADAVRLVLGGEVHDRQVVPELLARRPLVEVLGAQGRTRGLLSPVERDAAVLHEAHRVVDASVLDPPPAVDDPRLVDLVLGEPVRVEQARPEVAVDHAHRGVAEHHHEDSATADVRRDIAGDRERGGRGGRAVGDLVLGVGDAARLGPLGEAVHEGRVGRPVGRGGPGARVGSPYRLEARAGVEQAHEPGPAAAEVARQKERVVLADDAVAGVRPVEPVHADADHRIVDGSELLDGLVGLREETRDAVRRAAEALQRGLELDGGFLDARQRQLVRLRARITGPEHRDLLRHAARLTPYRRRRAGAPA